MKVQSIIYNINHFTYDYAIGALTSEEEGIPNAPQEAKLLKFLLEKILAEQTSD